MFTQPRNNLAVIAATGLVVLALASTSARASHDHANHDHNVVAPLVAGFALGALLNYGQSSHHYYRYQYQRHGHFGHGSGHGYRNHNNHGHYKKSHSKGHYGHKPRHSSSRGNRHTPRRKH